MKRLFQVALLVLVGWFAWRSTAGPERLPHSVAKQANGIALHLGHVKDVIYQHYPQHTDLFYQRRNEVASKAEGLDPIDDLAVGLDRLGKPAEAVTVLRKKLRLQEKQGLKGIDLYTTYANLGTTLIHANYAKAMSGDQQARQATEEGLNWIQKAVEVNPDAHFGREYWQIRIVEFLLQAMDDPKVLLQQDMLGNELSLERGVGGTLTTEAWEQYRLMDVVPDNPTDAERRDIRTMIAVVGEPPVPFDEPVLGILGMWRMGGGPNPHFALALAETLDRIGELELAWSAYERAVLMNDRFWPEDEIRAQIQAYCRAKQTLLEDALGASAEELRGRFQTHFDDGLAYQEKYREFEETRLESGVDIQSTNLFLEFQER